MQSPNITFRQIHIMSSDLKHNETSDTNVQNDGIAVCDVEFMTPEIMKNLTDDMHQMLYIDNNTTTPLLTDEELAESLRDDDYVKAVINIKGEEYLIYHGFPGDTPTGILVDPRKNEVITCFGENPDHTKLSCNEKYLEIVNMFNDWYNENPNYVSYGVLYLDTDSDAEDEGDDDGENVEVADETVILIA